jgi:hypothetical protein
MFRQKKKKKGQSLYNQNETTNLMDERLCAAEFEAVHQFYRQQ